MFSHCLFPKWEKTWYLFESVLFHLTAISTSTHFPTHDTTSFFFILNSIPPIFKLLYLCIIFASCLECFSCYIRQAPRRREWPWPLEGQCCGFLVEMCRQSMKTLDRESWGKKHPNCTFLSLVIYLQVFPTGQMYPVARGRGNLLMQPIQVSLPGHSVGWKRMEKIWRIK